MLYVAARPPAVLLWQEASATPAVSGEHGCCLTTTRHTHTSPCRSSCTTILSGREAVVHAPGRCDVLFQCCPSSSQMFQCCPSSSQIPSRGRARTAASHATLASLPGPDLVPRP